GASLGATFIRWRPSKPTARSGNGTWRIPANRCWTWRANLPTGSALVTIGSMSARSSTGRWRWQPTAISGFGGTAVGSFIPGVPPELARPPPGRPSLIENTVGPAPGSKISPHNLGRGGGAARPLFFPFNPKRGGGPSPPLLAL